MKYFSAVVIGLCLGLSAHAAGEALVTSVSGEVQRLRENASPETVHAFVQLNAGDRIRLGGSGKASVIIPAAARQENWQGPGIIELGPREGRSLGSASIASKPLPPQFARQIGRTPSIDASGKVGMVRVRALGGQATLEDLESDYRAYRAQAETGDKAPELFFLAGLFEQKAFDRLRQELSTVVATYPDDPEIKALKSIYEKAIRAQTENR